MKLADVGMMEFDEVMAGNKEPDFLAYVTETYRPPELFQCDISRKHLRAAVDTYSAGMTLYEALVGRLSCAPFQPSTGSCTQCRAGARLSTKTFVAQVHVG